MSTGSTSGPTKLAPARWREFGDARFTLQVSAEDCTGCSLCVEVCPAKSKSEVRHRAIDMTPRSPIHEREAAGWRFFLDLPDPDRRGQRHQFFEVAQRQHLAPADQLQVHQVVLLEPPRCPRARLGQVVQRTAPHRLLHGPPPEVAAGRQNDARPDRQQGERDSGGTRHKGRS